MTPADLRKRTGRHAWVAWDMGIGPWAPYGPHNPAVRPSVPRKIPRSWWVWRKAWVKSRNLALEAQTKQHRLLIGVVRDITHVDVGTHVGAAFVAAGGDRVLLQFADPVSDSGNAAQLEPWAIGWRHRGVSVDGWWRVNHRPVNAPPSRVGLDGWWPNAEDTAEIGRLGDIYQAPCQGVITLGKAPGAWPPPRGLLAAECFREHATSDHTVPVSVKWWLDAGLPLSRLLVMLQAYGTPFASLATQAEQAIALGVTRLGIYPLDGATPGEIMYVGRLLG